MTSKVYRVASGEHGENTVGIYGPVRALAYGLLVPKVEALLQDLSLDVEKMLNVGELEARLRDLFHTEGQKEFLPEFGVFVEYLPLLTSTKLGGIRPAETPGRKSTKIKGKGKGKVGRPRKIRESNGEDSKDNHGVPDFPAAAPVDDDGSDLDEETDVQP